jgi:ArsR family transcriptional regulator
MNQPTKGPSMARSAVADAAITPATRCAPLASADLTDAEAVATARLFKSLGDPNRVRIVNQLARAVGPVCACDLNRSLAVAQPTVSFHLKKLVEAGVLRRDPRGVWAYFSIDPVAAERLRGVLDLSGGPR